MAENLHQIARMLAAINRLIEANDGEVSDEVAEALDSVGGNFHRKVDIIRLLASKRRAKAEWHRSRSKVHSDRATAIENAADRWEEWIIRGMDAAGLDIAGTVIPIRIVNNGIPSIRWAREGEPIPKAFQRIKTVIELDTELAREAAKLKTLPDGFEVKRGRHLRVASVNTKRKKKG